MVVDITHYKWRKKLLKSRREDVYYRINDKKEVKKDIFISYDDGTWEIAVEDNLNTNFFKDVDRAAEHIISLGIEYYEVEFSLNVLRFPWLFQ
ncbi:hypothetical protein FB550_101773 [Neobacillus bataviensis]|uniref:Uncharacterized protein n=1 Tax=Neobacillus bataviensis TaxID=220685 RepID=A0A561DZF3_9BACI|nr:hypothetical protein [Neobacillus bataviensis]TWE08745.1 hypothetical protein FB550_101773 [Neobacillus bataviensis]